MDRMIKSASQISSLFAANISGCLTKHLAPETIHPPVDIFKIGATEVKPLATPSFLVPSIIDALKQSSRYGALVRLVPGEADNYCAEDIICSGGIVITSDSDLLAQDLGAGEVVFFRDVHSNDDGHIVSAVFAMADIMQRLGLNGSSDAPRFAYERKLSPQSSLQVLVKACKFEVADAKGYASFLRQYEDDDTIPQRIVSIEGRFCVESLDPRLSEVFYQLILYGTVTGTENIRMFLPILVESHERGTAWEPTTTIRQLAYSLLTHAVSSTTSSIKEYRRVENPGQKGRSVTILAKVEADEKATEILTIMSRLKGLVHGKGLLLLPLLSMTLDVMGCHNEGKKSHVLKMLQSSNKRPVSITGRVSWELTHFVAHLHAGLYSFRMLKQALDTLPQQTKREYPWQGIYNLVGFSLNAMPNFEEARSVISEAYKRPLGTILTEFTDMQAEQIGLWLPHTRKRKGQPEKRREEPRPYKKQSKQATVLKNNRFGSLAMDD